MVYILGDIFEELILPFKPVGSIFKEVGSLSHV